MTPQADQPGQGQAVSSLSRLLALVRPYRYVLLLAILMLIGLTAVNIFIPQLIAIVFDEVFKTGDWMLLFTVLATMLGLYVLRNLLYFGGKSISVSVAEDVCFGLRKRLFERLQHMNLNYYHENKPGQLSSRVMNDSYVIQQFIQNEFPSLMQAVLMFTGIMVTIYVMNWQLAIASTLVLPLHVTAFFYLRRPIKQASSAAQRHLADATGNLIEKFLGIEVVKGFTGESRENSAFEHAIDLSRKSELRGQRYHVLQKVLADLLVGLGVMLLIGFGAYQVVGRPADKALAPGDFIAFFWYIGMLYPTVIEMMSGSAKLARTSAGIDRVYEVLDLTPDEADGDEEARLSLRGELAFRDVSFQYQEGKGVLNKVSFDVKQGQVCAILGSSGVGKTTLVSLVPRLIEPTAGRVMIDGQDNRQLPLRELRRSVGVAFQEAFLFNSTILENLRYARPDADRDDVIRVMKRIGMHAFVMGLPKGYDTRVGDEGLSLSRGQKQMITLARAILKDPKVLILDEATASIDVAHEAAIIPVILEFMKGKTTLMVTHRPELLKHVDKVIHLEDGRIGYDGEPEGFDAESFAAASILNTDTDNDDVGTTTRPGLSQGGGVLNRLLIALLVGVSCLAGATSARADEGTPPKGPAKEAHAEPAQPAAEPEKPAEKPAAEPVPMPANADVKASRGQLIPMPGMNRNELREVMQVVAARLSAELGYNQIDTAPEDMPKGMDQVVTLSLEEGKATRIIQIGYRHFVSQPGQVRLVGRRVEGDKTTENDHLKRAAEMVKAASQANAEEAKSVGPADLKTARIELSYIEADRCLAVLKSLGIQTIEYKKSGDGVGRAQLIEPTANVDPANLPAVMLMPGPDGVGLVGASQTLDPRARYTASGLMNVAADMPNMTSASPMMHMLVFYHPHHPEQYAKVLDLIRRSIDLPAGQIVIEAMVLEISETGLRQLGVQWELESPFLSSSTLDGLDDVQLGRFPTITGGPTLDVSISDINNHWRAQIKALITSGQAEILSRPSVLALDNRQASIRVGEDIPIAKSVQGTGGGDKIAFDFEYLPIGILLNVRPRVSADGEEVSMQIDGIVSSQVPGEDLILLDKDNNELARAPRIASRRVQTHTRIANNTPFIIGGLVSKDVIELQEKVPLLGDIPIIGNAFKSTTSDRLKREVIIVITPYVLPRDQIVGRNTPEDEDAFDSFDNELFRDAYRIRAEDVFDLRFLFENLQVQKMLDLAGQVIRRRPDYAEVYPFDRFADARVPGERILVYRMMYEVIKRRGIDDHANPSRMIFFKGEPDHPAGFQVEFFEEYLAGWLGVKKPTLWENEDWLFNKIGGKAVAVTFTEHAFDGGIDAPTQPVPDVSLVDCADRDAWGAKLWELNQPDAQGNRRFTILLKDGRDIRRLRRAVVLKQTVTLNATHQSLRLRNFTQGRLLLVPTIKDDQVFLIDEDVAQYFFYTEHYYPALQSELQRDMEALRNILRDPEYGELLDNPRQVDQPIPWRPIGR